MQWHRSYNIVCYNPCSPYCAGVKMISLYECVLCRHRPPLRPQRRVMKMRKPCHRMTQTPRRSSMVGSAASPIHQDVSEKYVCTPRVVLCVPLLTNCSLVHSCSEGQRWLWGGREISSGDGRSNQVCSMLRSSTKRSKEVEFEIKWECSELVFHMHLKFWLVSVCLHQSVLFVQLMVASLASFNAFAVFSDAAEHCVEFSFDCVAVILKKSCLLISALMLSSLTCTASATNLPLASKWNKRFCFGLIILCCDLFLCSLCL